MQAFSDVIQHPREAADIVIKANPEYAKKKEVLAQQIEADVKHTFFSGDTKVNGIGWMTADAWQKTIETLLEQDAMKASIDPAKAFTDKYLAEAKPPKH